MKADANKAAYSRKEVLKAGRRGEKGRDRQEADAYCLELSSSESYR